MEYNKEVNTMEPVHFASSSQAMQASSSNNAPKKCALPFLDQARPPMHP